VKILILGYATRGMTEMASLSSSKHQLFAVDYFGDVDQAYFATSLSLQHDLELKKFTPEMFLEASAGLDYEAVVYTSGLENLPDVLEQVVSNKTLLGNSTQTLRKLQDSKALYNLLKAHNIAFPQVLFPGQRIPRGKWLLKNQGKDGGQGVEFSKPGSIVPEGYIAQQYYAGYVASVSFVADGHNCKIIGCSEQLSGAKKFGARGFLYSGNIVPLNWQLVRERSVVDISKMAAILTKEYQLKGLNGIDFLLLPSGKILFLELNPRYCASMELYWYACGIDIFRLHLESCLGVLPPVDFWPEQSDWQDSKFWGKAIVYARRDVQVIDNSQWFKLGVRDIPHKGELIAKGAPICTIFACAHSRTACLQKLYLLQERLFSHDIQELVHGSRRKV
jgi:predicted ATP-grasp superfamily ATP-dependent carboligase